jgi:predicted nucleic acid-binding protein
MRYGVERLPDGKKKRALSRRYDFLRQDFGDWVLDFDESAASDFGRYVAEFEAERGLRAVEEADLRDLQIAAIARSRGWTVATRNTTDFPLIDTVNPFEAWKIAGKSKLLRMDNVLIVVDELEAAKAFFVELGRELEGETTVRARVARNERCEGIVNSRNRCFL